jgi:hypothetical protein
MSRYYDNSGTYLGYSREDPKPSPEEGAGILVMIGWIFLPLLLPFGLWYWKRRFVWFLIGVPLTFLYTATIAFATGFLHKTWDVGAQFNPKNGFEVAAAYGWSTLLSGGVAIVSYGIYRLVRWIMRGV